MNSLSILLNQLSINSKGSLDIVIDESNVNQILKEHLPSLVSNLYSGDIDLLLKTTIIIRKILSIEGSPPIQQIVDTGIVTRLIQFLNIGNIPILQLEASWAITNIAAGSTQQTKFVIDNGAIQAFIILLNSTDIDEIREQVIWALGNMATEVEDRNTILSFDVFPPIINILQNHSPPNKLSLIRNTTWAVSNLCRSKPRPPFKFFRSLIPVLANLLNNHIDEDVLIDVCWTLSYLADGYTDEEVQEIINENVCPRLIKLLDHSYDKLVTPALRTIGNFVTCDNTKTQILLDLKLLPRLFNLLHSPNKLIAREICWTISNIAAGNKHQVQQIIDANIFPELIVLLDNENTDINVSREVLWVFSNSTNKEIKHQTQYLVDLGCIKSLCKLLKVQNDKYIIEPTLQAIENILSAGKKHYSLECIKRINPYFQLLDDAGGVDLILQVKNSINLCDDVKTIAKRIIDYYIHQEKK